MTESAKPSPFGRWQAWVLVGILGLGAAIVAALTLSNAANATACPLQKELGTAIGDAAQGELAALNGTGTGRGYKDLTFVDAENKQHTLAEFAGKALLVNFWATWCVPCREEMPALNALAQKYDGDTFEVLPINLEIASGGFDKAKAFLAQANVPNLPLYVDATSAAWEKMKKEAVSIGLPTTLVLDGKGCELGVLQGPARWDSPDGDRVVQALIALQSKAGAGPPAKS